MLGSQIEAMSEAELSEAIHATSIFAKLAPEYKQHIIRIHKIPLIQSRASWLLVATSLNIVAVGAWLTVSPLFGWGQLGFFALPPLYWLLLAIMLVCYVILTQVVKTWFFHKFGD